MPHPLKADRVSKRGRTLTIIAFAIVLVMLAVMFYWLGARRINNYFVSQGNNAFDAQQYAAAVDSYGWAIRFDRRDAHSVLNRGYARQKMQQDDVAL
ncbi:MAG TPA: hypothetical protein VFX76_03835, partial [Roseiflexaceae bacterium]|nr:hypothetical protein [Roseiflexaceae bacterium]